MAARIFFTWGIAAGSSATFSDLAVILLSVAMEGDVAQFLCVRIFFLFHVINNKPKGKY